MRDHSPITLEQFNGLWSRGSIEETPMDHFTDCSNIKFVGSSGFASRDGIDRHQSVAVPLAHILRMYNYPTSDKNTILVLTTGGNIYHIVDSATIFGPILTIAAMTDFGFAPYNGRAYITPFTTEVVGGLNRERGLTGEFVYVYLGDGTNARKAGNVKPTTPLVVANDGPGLTDAGVHIFGYVFETNTGYQSAPGGLVAFTTNALNSLDFSSVAIDATPGSPVTKRHIVASKVIQAYNGDVNGYQLFFIPSATIPNNVGTTLNGISFFDQDLLLDASHLSDNLANIPAGVNLVVYHNRMCCMTEFDNISLVRVSHVGEPESFSAIDGICLVPPDGNPVTNAAELRDVLYVTKRNKTVSFVDNGDEPSSWPLTVVDNGVGAGVHSIATVLDAGSASVDYLLIGAYKGLILFNGRYILPELSWKIQQFWLNMDFNHSFRKIQIVNDTVDQVVYLVTTDGRILYGNYANGLDPKSTQWSPWQFDVQINTLCLINVNELLIGSEL